MKYGQKNRQKGFTLPEMLIVILITVVLLAISLVGIVTYMRHLQLAELDNAAKEIFLSAQNRAILLSGGQRLEQYVVQPNNRMDHVEVAPGSGDTTQITAYYIHSSDVNLQQLMPEDTIDPALWDGDFYIIYEPKSGSVVDVFFNYKTLPVDNDFPAFYKQWRAAPKTERMNSKPMIGYYGGESAKSDTAISLRTPVINIYNENTLWAEVVYWIPRSLHMTGEANHVQLTATLNYQGENRVLQLADAEKQVEPGLDYFAYTYTWILDSLDEIRFKNFFHTAGNDLSYGNDFTLIADLSYTGDLSVNGASKTAQDNSLFASGSQGDTAYIACLRHLQNLDTEFSEVDEKIHAVQLGDIQEVKGYTFQPIRNTLLQSYDGRKFSIYNLHVGPSRTMGAGLFGTFSGTETAPKELRGIRLLGTSVSAGSGPAGALIGVGEHLRLTDCQVYWENQSDQTTNLRDVLGDSVSGLRYQITTSGPAGGLAGRLKHTAVDACSASTLVKSTGPVGGLVGEASGLTLTGSYAASYLQGHTAAGLVGNLVGNSRIASSYAVGFIDSGTRAHAAAAGLCLGSGAAQVVGSYSAMLFTSGDQVTNYPLCQKGTYSKTAYLDSKIFAPEQADKQLAKSYHELTDPAQWDRLFGRGTFTEKSAAQSHPYNLQTTLALTTFIYPGLEGIEHWGDWGGQFQNGSLVYYERYQDGSLGFNGGDISHLSDKIVIEDGYAVAYRGTDATSGIGATLEITYLADGKEQTGRFTYGHGESNEILEVHDVTDPMGEKGTYYLLPLPGEIVNTNYAARDFYQKISITDVGERTERIYYYNPHFANTVLHYDENLSLSQLARQLRVEVRSPRHLYMLSRFDTYFTSSYQYRFLQQLDLDYDQYIGYELFAGVWSQHPIGLNARKPFRSNYYGNCHTISGVQTTARDPNGHNYPYVGLFGYSTSVLRDIVYRMDDRSAVHITQQGSSSDIIYVGGLVGYNGGTVENCAVSGTKIQANCYSYSTVYLGGLVGLNKGTIYRSSVDVRHLDADASMSHIYTGGFVGRNMAGGAIDQCYALGKITVARARYGNVYASGFAGRNEATLSRSYAAVSLMAEGGSQSFGFCPDNSTNCVYLNTGNFTYRDEHYAAQYEDPHAAPVTWEELTGEADSEKVDALGMERPTVSFDFPEEAYPYPGTVKNQHGDSIHYGNWPRRMDLGTMGVYYWEKLDDSYYFSVLSQENSQMIRSSTLPTVHGDGKAVTEYGYGYFHKTGSMRPALTSHDIYWDDHQFDLSTDPQAIETNKATDEALLELMGGKYTFYSYNTWRSDTQEGLHLITTDQNRGGTQPLVGVWTLKRGGETLEVKLNPLFADSMSQRDEELPGTEANPYQVRSIEQLQFINWNGVTKNTNTVLIQENSTQFPFLSYGNGGKFTQRSFFWEQTHDLDGKKRVYSPVAEFYDPTGLNQGGLFGWFGGTYNGKDYVIADVNIRGQISSCVGLFGAVFDGTLKNIVLHSTDGTATVEGSSSGDSRWYAIGGLAGLAGSRYSSAVVNCAVTGYTIQDTHQTTPKGGWGGTGLGGLIGISDMSLEGCTAVTDLYLNSRDNDNVRVGGLVGSCQGKISSCYAGGEITVDPDSRPGKTHGNHWRGIYVGGIVGGIYMKPLKVGGSAQFTVGQSGQELTNTLENCYSYTVLPDLASNEHIKGLYAVGGSGELNRHASADKPIINADHGWTNYDNSYFLESVSLKNNNGTIGIQRTDIQKQGITGLTYAQMSDTEGKDGLLYRLNAGGGRFATVTTRTVGGASISGRYSFGSDPSLLGKDYPFPTILTQTSSVAPGGRANVHYGDWPLAGIRREHGALPIGLDLFSDYQEQDQGAIWTETLSLSSIPTGGTWGVTSRDDTIVEAELKDAPDNGKLLRVTGKKAGSTVLTVSYQVGGESYTLDIEVNVTAQLWLTATANSPVLAFRDQVAPAPGTAESETAAPTIRTPLVLLDKNGKRLPEGLEPVLSDFTVEFDHSYFTKAAIQQEQDALFLSATSSTAAGATQMTVGYSFRYLGTDYQTTSALLLHVAVPELSQAGLEFIFEKDGTTEPVDPEPDFSQGEEANQPPLELVVEENKTQPQTQQYSADSFTLVVDGETKPVSGAVLKAFEPVAPEFADMIGAEWVRDAEGKEQVGTLSITAYPQQTYPAKAEIKVQFQFEYEGSTHTLWQILPIEITLKSEEVQP